MVALQSLVFRQNARAAAGNNLQKETVVEVLVLFGFPCRIVIEIDDRGGCRVVTEIT